MNGGVYIKDEYKSSSDAFKYFLENSKISYLSEGSFGIVLKCKLNYSVKTSPYEHLRNIYQGEDVRAIIIKISLLHGIYEKMFDNELELELNKQNDISEKGKNRELNQEEIDEIEDGVKQKIKVIKPKYNDIDKYNMKIGNSDETIYSVHADNFKHEVKKQVEIFNITVDKLDPICPSVIYSNYLNESNENEMEQLLELIYKNIIQDKKSHNEKNFIELMDEVKIKNKSFGLIGMEMMGDYEPLSDFPSNYIQISEDIARLRLIQMAVKTGYTHNDFHQNNILLNPNESGYYGKDEYKDDIGKDEYKDDIEGHIIIIDFGFATKISPRRFKELKENYDNNNFYDIILFFYMILGKDKQDRKIYDWIIPEELMDEKPEEDFKKLIIDFNKRMSTLKTEYEKYEATITNVKHKKMFTYEMDGGMELKGKNKRHRNKTVKINSRAKCLQNKGGMGSRCKRSGCKRSGFKRSKRSSLCKQTKRITKHK